MPAHSGCGCEIPDVEFSVIKQYLLSPGPTAVPERVLLRMATPMIHHCIPQFSAVFAESMRLACVALNVPARSFGGQK